jgi:hypothetical protein
VSEFTRALSVLSSPASILSSPAPSLFGVRFARGRAFFPRELFAAAATRLEVSVYGRAVPGRRGG